MFDLILRGGWVIDGSGAPAFRADVGIVGDRIAAAGNLQAAESRKTLEIADRILCPGFIDTHVHGDLALLADPLHPPAIYQGVTTYVIGQDGCGFAPASPGTIDYMRQYTAGFTGRFPDLVCDWRSLSEYLDRFENQVSLNVAYLIPNGTVRMEVMGLETRPPTAPELKEMQKLVRRGMEEGAVGLSTGLDYIPSKYADRNEISALAKVAADHDGVYVSHVRAGGGPKWHEALDELAQIGMDSGCALHVSHFNVRADEHLPRIDAMRRLGLDVTYDTYPYLAGMTILAMIVLPDSIQEGGVEATLQRLEEPASRAVVGEFIHNRNFTPSNIRLVGLHSARFSELEGMTLKDACEVTGLEFGELACELLVDSKLAASAIIFDGRRTEADVMALLQHPAQMSSSDGIFTGQLPHPRGYGSFARFLGEYVRKRNAWSWETAIHHLTYHPARRYRLPDRGLVAKGKIADLVVFDPESIADRSTYSKPKELAVGVEHVLVSGVSTLENGVHTGATAGKGLRRAD